MEQQNQKDSKFAVIKLQKFHQGVLRNFST